MHRSRELFSLPTSIYAMHFVSHCQRTVINAKSRGFSTLQRTDILIWEAIQRGSNPFIVRFIILLIRFNSLCVLVFRTQAFHSEIFPRTSTLPDLPQRTGVLSQCQMMSSCGRCVLCCVYTRYNIDGHTF